MLILLSLSSHAFQCKTGQVLVDNPDVFEYGNEKKSCDVTEQESEYIKEYAFQAASIPNEENNNSIFYTYVQKLKKKFPNTESSIYNLA